MAANGGGSIGWRKCRVAAIKKLAWRRNLEEERRQYGV
jgi:hypothetical protein